MGATSTQQVPDPQKRRSTRIVQAVPLTVTGVDALGRPFQERTSTLAINCHGCRYQSKHYVLKNMWITLEVPHAETGCEPLRVRGRVTWIQRPRTVRELFQIGAELETPGNLWGIAFPPGDWFPFVESVSPPLPEPGYSPELEESKEPARLESVDNNVWVMPGAGTESSLTMARQVSKLVNEARQQIQATVREAASRALAEEMRPLMMSLQTQFNEAAGKSLEELAQSYAERVIQNAVGRIEQARDAGLETLREQWRGESGARVAEAVQLLSGQLAEALSAQQTGFEKHIEMRLNSARETLDRITSYFTAGTATAAETSQRLRQEIDHWVDAAAQRLQGALGQQMEEARAQLAHLEAAAARLNDSVAQTAASAESGWKARLEADIASAGARWDEKIETSMAAAAQHAAERLARHADSAMNLFEQGLAHRSAAFRQTLEQSASETQSSLAGVRLALDEQATRAREAVALAEQAGTRLAAAGEAAARELDRRFEGLLQAAGGEIAGRTEDSVLGAAARLESLLEAAGKQTVARLAVQIEEQLADRLKRAGELVKKLAAGQSSLEQALRAHEQRLRDASEQVAQQTTARFREISAEMAKDFEEATRAMAARSLAELDEKITASKHGSFEEIYKAAEWYEKKFQTQLQSTLEKGIEHAGAALREKAGEVSSMLAAELDRTSRSFVEHTQSQIEEAGRELVEQSRSRFAEAADITAARFGDDLHGAAQREFERFTSSVGLTAGQHTSALEAHAAQLRAKAEADHRQSLADFQQQLAESVQQSVGQAGARLEAQAAQIQDAWRAGREEEERLLREAFAKLGDSAVGAYKDRLENVSNSWLVATVTTFNQQTQEVIARLADSAEQQLRATCARVFANAGEAIRQRLLDLASFLPDHPSTSELS